MLKSQVKNSNKVINFQNYQLSSSLGNSPQRNSKRQLLLIKKSQDLNQSFGERIPAIVPKMNIFEH